MQSRKQYPQKIRYLWYQKQLLQLLLGQSTKFTHGHTSYCAQPAPITSESKQRTLANNITGLPNANLFSFTGDLDNAGADNVQSVRNLALRCDLQIDGLVDGVLDEGGGLANNALR